MVQREHKICLVSGSEKTEHLVRLVIAPDGKALPDLSGKVPGPGLWVAADKALIEQAFRRVFLWMRPVNRWPARLIFSGCWSARWRPGC